MSEEILQPNQPAKFEARGIRTHYKRLKAGEIFHVDFEVGEDVWNQLRTVPENALLEVVLWHHDGDPDPAAQPEPEPQKQPKEKEYAGPFWAYWQYMFAHTFYNYPSIIETLECAGEQIKFRLYDIFQVTTCADIAPTEFETWMQSEGPEKFAALINMSRLAQAAVPEIERRAAEKALVA